MNRKDVSIAIVNWNTRDLLDQCLRSVYESSKDLSFEIVLVDNASSDGSADMVEAKYPQVKLIRNSTNPGFATACNLAFEHCGGRYFMLLNSDTIVLDHALSTLCQFMDQHPEAGAAGCRLLNKDGTLQRSCSRFPGVMTELYDALYLSKLFPKSRLLASYSMSFWDFGSVREVDFAGGSCLIVRNEAIADVGLLDEGYFMYTEEADWCYRMKKGGWKIFYVPDASIVHLGGSSSRRYGSQILVHLYSSRNRFVRKHRGVACAFLHRAVVVVGALCRLPVFALSSAIRRTETQAVSFQMKLLRWALLNSIEGRKVAD